MPDLLDKLLSDSSDSTFGHGFNVNHTAAVCAKLAIFKQKHIKQAYVLIFKIL